MHCTRWCYDSTVTMDCLSLTFVCALYVQISRTLDGKLRVGGRIEARALTVVLYHLTCTSVTVASCPHRVTGDAQHRRPPGAPSRRDLYPGGECVMAGQPTSALMHLARCHCHAGAATSHRGSGQIPDPGVGWRVRRVASRAGQR